MKRIVAFIENGRYYSKYVYVEANEQKPTKVNKKYYSREYIEDLKKNFSFMDEEYAIYRPCALYKKIVTKQEEDDRATKILSRLIHMKRQNIETRVRYLTDYNFIIAAKGSAFNNAFNSTSEAYFIGLLDGSVKIEEFHDYMMRFPKPDLSF